jgi:hypothetical protein
MEWLCSTLRYECYPITCLEKLKKTVTKPQYGDISLCAGLEIRLFKYETGLYLPKHVIWVHTMLYNYYQHLHCVP